MHSSVRRPITRVGRAELGGRQLGGAPGELVGRGAETRHDDAADEPSVGRHAVEGGGGAEVHDDRVAVIELDRGERVHDPVGADAQRLVHVERDRQRRARVHLHAGAAGGPRDAGDHAWVTDGATDARHTARTSLGEWPAPSRKPPMALPHSSGVRPGIGREPPVRLELGAAEQADGDLGVADVEGQEHGARGSRVVGHEVGEREAGAGRARVTVTTVPASTRSTTPSARRTRSAPSAASPSGGAGHGRVERAPAQPVARREARLLRAR